MPEKVKEKNVALSSCLHPQVKCEEECGCDLTYHGLDFQSGEKEKQKCMCSSL
jgi:hypothetical protein